MSTYTHHIQTMNSVTPANFPGKAMVTNIIDFGDGKGANSAAYTATETLDVLKIPAGSILLEVGAFCMKAEGATATIDLITVGAEGSDATEINDFDINTAYAGTTGTTQKRFIADGTIQLLLNTVSVGDTAVVYVWASYIYDMDVKMRTATASL